MENNYRNVRKNQTASNILYLFLSFPLGVFYFIFLITGLSVGLSTLIVWVGIPILMLVLIGIWGMASLERELAIRLLHVEMPSTANMRVSHTSWRSWFRARLSDPLTWKSLIYLLIKFPLGIFSFCLALTLVVTSIALILEPIAYLINVNINGLLMAQGVESHSWLPFVGWVAGGQFDPLAFARSFIGMAAGLALWVVVRSVLNGLAWMLGEFARVMLTPLGSNDVRPKDEYAGYHDQTSRYPQQVTY